MRQKRKGNLLLDYYPDASMAYSLRKLRSLYSGYCIRVKRSSDNTEADIGFVNDVVDQDSLATFVGAGDAIVTKWYDQSGNNNIMNVRNTAGQPKIVISGNIVTYNSKIAINTNTGAWSTGNIVAGSGDFSTFTIYKRLSTGDRSIFFGPSSGYNPYSPFEFPNGNVYFANRVSQNYYADNTAIQSLYSGFSIDNILTIWKNGSEKSLTYATQNNDAGFSTIGVRLGDYSNSYFHEGILYNFDQSENREAIESNMNSFYSIY